RLADLPRAARRAVGRRRPLAARVIREALLRAVARVLVVALRVAAQRVAGLAGEGAVVLAPVAVLVVAVVALLDALGDLVAARRFPRAVVPPVAARVDVPAAVVVGAPSAPDAAEPPRRDHAPHPQQARQRRQTQSESYAHGGEPTRRATALASPRCAMPFA